MKCDGLSNIYILVISYVISAFECSPNTSGVSIGGRSCIASRNWSISFTLGMM